MAITLRSNKGTALTYNEVDTNFTSLFYSASLSGSSLVLHYLSSSLNATSPIVVELSKSPWTASIGGDLSRTGNINIIGSLTQGYLGNIATGTGSHAQGTGSEATANYSHAEGEFSIASNIGAHAEGYYNIASGEYAHAEGDATEARGWASHAEGGSTVALIDFSHAEGGFTLAYQTGSHAEGYYTTASGFYAHAEGWGTIAQGDYQHAQGKHNIVSPVAGAFIHGNGINDSNRSNLIYAHDNVVEITGSLNVKDIISLAPRTTAPTGVEGMIISSGSAGASVLYYYNGTTWNALF